MRTCNKCHEAKSIEDFYVRPRNQDGLSKQCRRCEIARSVEWGRENRVKRNAQSRARGPRPAEQVRRHRLWTWYRITPERFDEMLAAQGSKCAIPACPATEPGGKGQWHVDHDHACCDGPRSCGECVRGLLCCHCNVMLAMARDSGAILASAGEYVQNAAMSALGAIGQTG